MTSTMTGFHSHPHSGHVHELSVPPSSKVIASSNSGLQHSSGSAVFSIFRAASASG